MSIILKFNVYCEKLKIFSTSSLAHSLAVKLSKGKNFVQTLKNSDFFGEIEWIFLQMHAVLETINLQKPNRIDPSEAPLTDWNNKSHAIWIWTNKACCLAVKFITSSGTLSGVLTSKPSTP